MIHCIVQTMSSYNLRTLSVANQRKVIRELVFQDTDYSVDELIKKMEFPCEYRDFDRARIMDRKPTDLLHVMLICESAQRIDKRNGVITAYFDDIFEEAVNSMLFSAEGFSPIRGVPWFRNILFAIVYNYKRWGRSMPILLKKYPKIELNAVKDVNSQSAMCVAVLLDNLSAARQLAMAGANVDEYERPYLCNCSENTLVFLAAIYHLSDDAFTHTGISCVLDYPQEHKCLLTDFDCSQEEWDLRTRWRKIAVKRERAFLIRDRLFEICAALQEAELPTLLLLEIIDRAVPVAAKTIMHTKWQMIAKIRHYRH